VGGTEDFGVEYAGVGVDLTGGETCVVRGT